MRFTTRPTFSIPSGSDSNPQAQSPTISSSSTANGGWQPCPQMPFPIPRPSNIPSIGRPPAPPAQPSNSPIQTSNSRPVPKRRYAGEYDIHLVCPLGHSPAPPISRPRKPRLSPVSQHHEEVPPPTSPGNLVLTFGGKPFTESRTRPKSPSSRTSSPCSGRRRSGSALAHFIITALPNFANEEWVGSSIRLRK